MSSLRVGVISRIPNLLSEVRQKLSKLSQEVVVNSLFENDVVTTSEFDVDVLVGDFDLLGPYVYNLRQVQLVQGTWAGIDALLPHIKVDTPPPTPILRYSGKHFGNIIAEYVIATIVNHERDVFKVYENQKIKLWEKAGRIYNYRTIYDLTIGVMGVGMIGSKLMEILNFLGAKVRGMGRKPTLELPYMDEYFPSSDLSQFLRGCDYIVGTLPNTAETKGLLDGNVLQQCQDKRSIFINVGRGGVISDECLMHAIEHNWLSHAYLDVFNKEPLPVENPMWFSSKVFITPHVAANSRAPDVAEQFVENLQLWLAGEPLPTKIDFIRGY